VWPVAIALVLAYLRWRGQRVDEPEARSPTEEPAEVTA